MLKTKAEGGFVKVVGTSELRPRGSQGGTRIPGPVTPQWGENYDGGWGSLSTCPALVTRPGPSLVSESQRCRPQPGLHAEYVAYGGPRPELRLSPSTDKLPPSPQGWLG